MILLASLLCLLPRIIHAWISSCPKSHHHNKLHVALSLANPINGADDSKSPTNYLIRQTDYLKNPRSPTTVNVDVDSPDPRHCLSLLQDALGSPNSTNAASELLVEVSTLRRKSNSETVLSDLLNSLLEQGPDNPKLPLWTKIRLFGRFSKRGRWASLRRTLDLTTPPPSSSEEYDRSSKDSVEDRRRRRRRALLTILRSLSSNTMEDATATPTGTDGSATTRQQTPPIRLLERKAREEYELSSSNKRRFNNKRDEEDLTVRRPEGLETPNYVVLEKKSNTFEVRLYEDFAVCSVSMMDPRPPDSSRTDAKISDSTMAGSKAFGALAGYLFGKNQQNQAMRMTTPVLMTNAAGATDGPDKVSMEEGKQMSFVLPSEYWENESILASAPQPLEGSGVTLERLDGAERAVVMFGGYASKNVVEKQTKRLRQEIEQDSRWRVRDGETVSVAQYNDPFTPPWKRLNEVSIAVLPTIDN